MPREVTLLSAIPKHWGTGLRKKVPAGTQVYLYEGNDYGLCGPDEVAVVLKPESTGFIAVPSSYVSG